jgi:hypothetical protein
MVKRGTARGRAMAIGVAAMVAAMSAQAAETLSDERTVDTVVFVGERVSIEPMEDPCEAEAKRTGELRCIVMDELYRATYRVVLPVSGTTPAQEVTFEIADHYGFPPFAHFSHALLFVAIDKDRNWLHKYQGIAMHRTTEGQWAACGEVDRRGVDKDLSHRARPLPFAEPIVSKDAIPDPAWDRLLAAWKEARGTYRIKGGQVRCLKGVPVRETYEIVRQGVMKAREVPLPPWPADR